MFLLAAAPAFAADPNPGFGIIGGGGLGPGDAPVRLGGFTTRRLIDGDRSGALTLMAEEFHGGLPFARLDPALRKEDVKLTYQAAYLEVKRYLPLIGRFNYFWGLRGGVTRLSGTIERAGQKTKSFHEDQIAPLWFLAVPLALENPGFLLLALTEGASAGLSFDIVPQHLWIDAQVSAAVLPRHRDGLVAVEQPFAVTRTLTLSLAF